MIPERREKLNKDFMEKAKKEVGFKDAPSVPAPAPNVEAPAPAPKP
jgi:hypothetical protein